MSENKQEQREPMETKWVRTNEVSKVVYDETLKEAAALIRGGPTRFYIVLSPRPGARRI